MTRERLADIEKQYYNARYTNSVGSLPALIPELIQALRQHDANLYQPFDPLEPNGGRAFAAVATAGISLDEEFAEAVRVTYSGEFRKIYK